jgi:hypothetical protein
MEKSLVFFVDGKTFHGGFADRLKGAVSMFCYSLCNKIDFRIYYKYPFELSDYLIPNQYNWTLKDGELSFNFFQTRLVNLVGDGSERRLTKLKTKKQIHAYANRDIVDQLNNHYKTSYTWGKLFSTLFKPTADLQKRINDCLLIINGEYICAVFRFQNLLDDFQEYDYQPLKTEEQSVLIEKCTKALLDLQTKSDTKNMLVTSDSSSFLQIVSELNNVFAFPHRVVHIDSVEGAEKRVYQKSFVDFYLLSGGKKIYSIGTKAMYKSEFPLYAAKVNDIEFERILIE